MNETAALPTIAAIAGLTLVTYILLIAAAQILRRSRSIRFGWAYQPFAVGASLLVGVHYGSRLVGADTEWAGRVLPHLTAVTLVLAAFPAVKVINRILWVRRGKEGKMVEAPRLLADTTALVVFVAVLLGVLQFIYEKEVPGLVAGSGVVAIILGLAMQDLLGNIFGGLSIYLEKPFKPGDWLHVENQDARVVEITWRSTRLINTDDVLIDVPNASIVKQSITNYERPTRPHALRIAVGLHYEVPPARAQQVLRDATASVPGVLSSRRPVVWVTDFADSSVNYEIKFWIEDHRFAPRIRSDVRSHAWYALKRAGMEIPFPIVTLYRGRHVDTEKVAREVATEALNKHAILSFFSEEQRKELVRHSRVALFAPNDLVIEQGAAGDSMFLIVSGKTEVRFTHGDTTEVVATFGPGDCFGEMSLLTGESRTATVVATEEVQTVEITRDVLTPLIHATPDVLNRLSDLLAERQAANEKLGSGAIQPAERAAHRATILHRLRRFFSVTN